MLTIFKPGYYLSLLPAIGPRHHHSMGAVALDDAIAANITKTPLPDVWLRYELRGTSNLALIKVLLWHGLLPTENVATSLPIPPRFYAPPAALAVHPVS